VGDLILSRSEFDPEGPLEAKRVEEVFVRTGRIWVTRVSGKEIRTTGEHPVHVEGRDWITVAEFKVGDRLSSHNRVCGVVQEVYDTGAYETVYNLRVADFHTYFVGSREWGFSVWAHNAYRIPWSRGEQPELFEADNYTPHPDLLTPGGLRRAAVETHNLLANPIGRENTTVSLAHVEFADGRVQIWGSGNSGYLTPAQRDYLGQRGVRLYSGDNHAEINIINSLPRGATIQRWGISWGVGRSGTSWNFPCGDCAPRVCNVPGAGILE
jgi:hypothetical protein